MAIQFPGLASGLDTNAIISKMMAKEQKPIDQLKNDKTRLSNQLTAFTQLDTNLRAFADALKKMGDTDSLQKRTLTERSNGSPLTLNRLL